MIEEDEKHKRWPKDFDEVDFREAIKNLKDYINLYCLDNKIRL
jgi:glutaredoxin-related protein